MTCLFPIQAIGRHLKSFCQQTGKRCVMVKFLQLLVSTMVIGLPAAGLAQFSDKGDHVEVKKGIRLCSSVAVDGVQRTVDQAPDILESDEPHASQWHADRFRAGL